VLEAGLPARRFRVGVGNVGLHVALRAEADFDDAGAADALAAGGVHVEALHTFCVARTDCRGFIVGYSAAPASEIEQAAHALVRGLGELTR
jgi:DNA-binding transcriptional MocR family regulator